MPALDICIDVSHFQQSVDWNRVFSAGICIAMIKASQGTGFVDPLFETHRKGALAAGLVVIPYHFVERGSPTEQANFFIKTAGLSLGKAYALDWEFYNGKTFASASDVEAIGNQVATITKRPPLGYWDIPNNTTPTPTSGMSTWPRWVKRYPSQAARKWNDLSPNVRNNVDKWWLLEGDPKRRLFGQYTAWGAVDGVVGEVDRSVAFFDSIEAAVAWIDGSPVPIPAPSDQIVTDFLDTTEKVQIFLKSRGFYKGVVDRDFGPASRAALQAYFKGK